MCCVWTYAGKQLTILYILCLHECDHSPESQPITVFLCCVTHSQYWSLGVPHLHFSHAVVQLEGAVMATGVPWWICTYFQFLVSSNKCEWGHSATSGLVAAAGVPQIRPFSQLNLDPPGHLSRSQLLQTPVARQINIVLQIETRVPGKLSHCPESFPRLLACDRVSVWRAMMWMFVMVQG